jgi:hypothetical protein
MRNLLILAKWLAGRANVDVRLYNGDTACITLEKKKRVILIPRAWNYSNDPDAAVLLEGVIDHEALGHGRFTNLEARQEAEDAGLIKFDNLSAAIQNILEDVYIENEAIKAYPGVKANLVATMEILCKRGFFGKPEHFEASGPSQLLVAGLLNVLRGTLIPGQETVLAENIEALNKLLPVRLGRVWIDVLAIAQEVKTSKSTEDNIQLTIRIMTVLKAAANSKTKSEQKPAEPERSPDQDDAGDANESSNADVPPEVQSAASDPADAVPEDLQEPAAGDVEPATDETAESAANDPTDAAPEDSQEPAAGDVDPATAETDESAARDPAEAVTEDSQEPAAGDVEAATDETDESAPGAPSDSVPDSSQEPTAGDMGIEGELDDQGSLSCTGESSDGASDVLSDEAIEAAREILVSQEQETFDTELAEVIAKVMDAIASNQGAVDLSESKPHGNFSDASKRIASKVKRISDDLQDALETQTKCERRTKLTGKRINSRVLSRPRLGNARIFRSKVEGEGVSTAVKILFDISGSMNEALADQVLRFDAACGLALGLGDVLDEYDVPFEVAAYSDRYVELKRFEDDWTAFRKADTGPTVFGGTHTGAAMQRALESLVCRDEDRRLLIVLTDGDTSDKEVLFSCYAEAQAMEVEIASVMIGPKIPAIEVLAQRFGFSAKHCNKSDGLGKFAVERILESI